MVSHRNNTQYSQSVCQLFKDLVANILILFYLNKVFENEQQCPVSYGY
jgi:hypothetical protein